MRPGGNFTHNAFFGATPSEGGVEAWYPPFLWFPDSIIDVGFTDIATHNYALMTPLVIVFTLSMFAPRSVPSVAAFANRLEGNSA